jgi:hypothetical protein
MLKSGHIAPSCPCPSQLTTDGSSVSMSWCRAPPGAHGQILVNCLTVTLLSHSGALSDKRSGLSFVCQSKVFVNMYMSYLQFSCFTCIIHTIYTQAHVSPGPVQIT